jgi:hypothetical protein
MKGHTPFKVEASQKWKFIWDVVVLKSFQESLSENPIYMAACNKVKF